MNGFDVRGMHHMITAIRETMSPTRQLHPERDTLFMGGATPTHHDEEALCIFGRDKNWKIVFPSIDTADPAAGPTGFRVVVTDGLTRTCVLRNGRLWKRSRDSAAVIRVDRLVISLSAKGRLKVGPSRGRVHEHGYDLALQAVKARAAEAPGRGALIAPIGGLVAVMDGTTASDLFGSAGLSLAA